MLDEIERVSLDAYTDVSNADMQAALRVFRAIEETAAFGVAKALYGDAHGGFGDLKIASIESGFPGVEQRSDGEDVVVEVEDLPLGRPLASGAIIPRPLRPR